MYVRYNNYVETSNYDSSAVNVLTCFRSAYSTLLRSVIASVALLASRSPLYVCRKLLVSPCSTRWIVSSKYQKHRSTLNLQGTYVCHLHRHVRTQQHHVRITSVYFCVLLAFSLMH